jgi:hypothetical protein
VDTVKSHVSHLLSKFVDQAGLDRLGGEVGTAHGDVTFRLRFQLSDRFRLKSRSIRVLAVDTRSSVLEYRSCRPPARSPRSPA